MAGNQVLYKFAVFTGVGLKFLPRVALITSFFTLFSTGSLAYADGGMRRSKNPASNIYGVQKNAIEDSFGDRGKNIDRSDFAKGKESTGKRGKAVKVPPTKIPTFDDLSVPSSSNPIVLPAPVESTDKQLKKGKWQEF